MKDKSILISMGIILYIIMAGVDRFVYRIPNIVYIPVAIFKYFPFFTNRMAAEV